MNGGLQMRNSALSTKFISVLVLFAFLSVMMAPISLAQESEPYQEEGSTASEAGLGVSSFLLTIPYGVTKVAFALAGGIVGGLAYLFSGLDDEPAKRIWTTSMYGTYIITPDHLKGNKAVRFLGVAEEEAQEF